MFNQIIFSVLANKRSLKRNINYVCSELFSEVVAISYTTDAGEDNIKALLTSILVIHDDYVRRVSHLEPGLAPKVFYKNLITSFNKYGAQNEAYMSRSAEKWVRGLCFNELGVSG